MKRTLILLAAVLTTALACQKTEEIGSLPAPANVVANLDGTTVDLSWDAVPGAISYVVRWNIEGDQVYDKSDLLTETTYKVEKLKDGTTYEFKVKAANNEAVSEFCEPVKVVIPKAEEPDMPTAATPEVSNVRAGLGWVNFTMGAFDGDCTYEVYDGNTLLSGAVLEKIKDNEDGTVEYSLGGLELNKDYSALKIKRMVADYLDSELAAFDAFKTGNIAALTRNPSARHIAFEWDDVAANANWTFNADIDPLTRTYKVEIATDEAFTNVVRSLYTVNNWTRDGNSKTGTFSANNWVGQSGTPAKGAKPYAVASTNLCVGQLEPATKYWVRIRTAAGESVDDLIEEGAKIEMNATCGKSVWSAPISITTEPAHVPAAGELLYQPFDDHAFSCDQINCAAGASPSGAKVGLGAADLDSEYAYPWKGEWGAFLPHTGARYDNLGVSKIGTFEGNGEDKLEKQVVYVMETDKIPSLKGWFCSKALYPQQGALKIGGSGVQINYLITPAFKTVADGTNVTISCTAGAAHASSTPAKLHIKIYRAATHTLEAVKTFDLPASAAIVNPDGSGNGYHNIVDMQPYSADAVLNAGDYISFEAETIKTPATNRLIIDNILVVKK